MIIRDLTEQRRLEEELRRNESRYRALYEKTPAMVHSIDRSGRLIAVSDHWLDTLGYRREEVLGRRSVEFMTEESRRFSEEALPGFFQIGITRNFPVQMRKKNGEVLDLLLSATAERNEAGEVTRSLAVLVDITERRRAEAALAESEQKFRVIVETTKEWIWTMDAEMRHTYSNPAIRDVLGYSPEEFVTQAGQQFLHPDDVAEAERVLGIAIAEKKGWDGVVLRWRRKDGSYRYLESKATPLFSDTGELLGFQGADRDITGRVLAEEAQRKSEELLRQLIEHSPVAVCIIDHAENLEYLNRKFIATFGYTREDIPDLPSWWPRAYPDEAYRRQIQTRWNAAVERAIAEGGEIAPMEARVTCKDGSIRYVEGYGTPVGTKFLVILNDISERKKAEEQIELLNTSLSSRAAELEDVNRELEAFSHTVSHDLRTPLTQVSGYVQLLQEFSGEQLGEQGKDFVREIAIAARRMGRLIGTLLKFSTMAHQAMHKVRADLSAIAADVAAELQLAEPQRRGRFIIPKRVRAFGDPLLLRVVLANLLGNAWKYTARREKAVVEFGITTRDGQKVFFVRDNGAGFAMKEADRLFLPFQRLHEGEYEGSGIGLATVQRIVHRHGGQVWAEGEVDKGATFYFTLGE
jgi:PAS domain S-box-containing protein